MALNPIIDKEHAIAPGIEKPLRDLVHRNAETLPQFRIKGLGLRQVLLEYAAVNALRLSRLSAMMYKLEEDISELVFSGRVDPKQMPFIYKLLTDSSKDAALFIQNLLKEIDWNTMESDILLSITQNEENQTSTDSKSMELLAKEVLTTLARHAAGG